LLIAAIVGLGLNANGRRRTAAARVEALFAVGPAKLEAALNSLRSSYRWARQPLDEAMHDEKRPAIWRGHMARIQCDDRVSESRIGMVDSLDRIPTEEVPMVIEVLRQSGPNAVDLLARKFAEASEPQVRARLATILLFLGQAGPARESLAVRLHPAERTRFIRDFAACAPEIGSLTALVRGVDDRDFESGICLAVGRIPAPQLAADVRSAWVDWLRQVFATSPGGGSHSAAQWALRQWNEPVPPLQPQDDPPTDRDWWVTEPVPGYRLTLVRIPAGSFLSGASVPDRLFELVSETRPVAPANVENFWVCTVEVEQGLFSIYRNSLPPERRAAERLDRFIPTDAAESAHLPVAGVNWEVAVDFCNWLSRQTGRAECYGAAAAFPLDLNASGWRLPLRLEWEYACLARATTLFPFGNLEQIDSLADYSWHLSPQIGFDTPVQEVGSKMPNPWGLFDMLGNANEWCSDGKLGIAESRFAVGGHNTSSIDALYAGFPGYNHFKIDRDFQGIRLCLPDRPPAGRDDPDQ
jgi:formylglycine-generating enzyme required for sulfatase activity